MIEITYVKGDATYPTGEGKTPDRKYIVHVCNDEGKWGRGFVLAISKRWEKPENYYKASAGYYLGAMQLIMVEDDIMVANLIAQHKTRRRGYIPIRYDAVTTCLEQLGKLLTWKLNNEGKLSTIHAPRIGCGLAGGSWNKIEKIIQKELCSRDIPVFIYDLNKD